ncbi:MAG: RHS repeat-associated core domain-containing protein, partial [Acidobacteria bacterium]|nr:RHS repeat-associated core domain-containing protein [Acidobacteriota bacterium]
HVGRRTTQTLPNNVTVTYSYDNASQLQEIVYKRALTTLGNVIYEYDAAGNRTKIGGSWARTGLPDPLASASYNAANQQIVFAGQTLIYDLNGNLTNDGSRTYTWNARNQLVSIASGAATIANFQYDAFGRRISKTIGGTTTGFVYDGANAVQELSGTSPTVNLLTGGIDENFTRTDATGTSTYLADGLGSTLALLDAAGASLSQYTYQPFGATTISGSALNASQFTGREHDGTGLYYYRARYYHPNLQRFISEDSIGFGDGEGLYSYANNNPLKFVDPSGNVALVDDLIVGGGILLTLFLSSPIGQDLIRDTVRDIADKFKQR